MPTLQPAVTLDTEKLLEQCDITFARRGGPGGQHRNKVSTAAILKHRPTGIIAEASERRSQADNRAVALRRLRIAIAMQVRDDITTFAQPLVSQYGTGNLRIATDNDHFPVVLADILNRIIAAEGEVQQAADFWKTSSSQIIRFLKQQPQALDLINQMRLKFGRHRLK